MRTTIQCLPRSTVLIARLLGNLPVRIQKIPNTWLDFLQVHGNKSKILRSSGKSAKTLYRYTKPCKKSTKPYKKKTNL